MFYFYLKDSVIEYGSEGSGSLLRLSKALAEGTRLQNGILLQSHDQINFPRCVQILVFCHYSKRHG